MTGYGESITEKEILLDSYVIISGIIEDYKKQNPSESSNDTDWKVSGAQSYQLTFREFHFSNYIFNEQALIKSNLRSSRDFVLMQFWLSGESSLFDEMGKENFSFKATEYNILFVPKDVTILMSYIGEPLELINVYLEKSFLSKYIPATHPFIKKINSNSLATLSANNLLISPKIHSVLQDIINCGFDGHLKKLYTQAKIIELLTLQLSQFEDEKKEIVSLKQSDIDKMMVVKNIITHHLNESLSLSYLARAAGTNEQYLKKNFKILFGCTVFSYILACKMEKAKELLLQGEYKIADVAELTGYKHATHFTSAFKKFFGYLPQKIKGKLEIVLMFIGCRECCEAISFLALF